MAKARGPGRPRKGGRPIQYRWGVWFKQNRFTLKKGVHYEATQSSMAQAIRNAAVRYRKRVSVVEGDGWFTVVVMDREPKEVKG